MEVHSNVKNCIYTKARSDQLLMIPTEPLTNREWLPGVLLSGP